MPCLPSGCEVGGTRCLVSLVVVKLEELGAISCYCELIEMNGIVHRRC